MSQPGPDDILGTYTRGASVYARTRGQSLFELPMLEQLARYASGREILDVGCGTGAPLAQWLRRKGFRLTGVDGARPMLGYYRRNVAGAKVVWQDMRHLALPRRFDAILAWDSFFHLSPQAQLRMFPSFGRLARPGAALVFSSGPISGVRYGTATGEPVYHASHDPLVYRKALMSAGFLVLRFRPNDPNLDFHSWWLCRKQS